MARSRFYRHLHGHGYGNSARGDGPDRWTEPDTAWQIIEGTQALTGSRTITATLLSNEPISNMLDRPDHAALILRCQDNVFAAYVA